jgi:hypothetical protein
MEQNFDALTYYSRFVQGDKLELNKNKEKLPKCDDYIDHAITESLWFQVILHSCSFLEEWDTVLGVKTEERYSKKVLEVKRIVAPAGRAIKKWKDLRKFRNEVIAHSFREKNGDVSLYTMSHYNCPQNQEELFYLVCFLNRMTMVLIDQFPEMIKAFHDNFIPLIQNASRNDTGKKPKISTLKESLSKVDKNINSQLFPTEAKNQIVESLINALTKNG